MKLRKLLVIIMVAALLAVYYIYGTDYLERRQDNAMLPAQIAAAAGELALIPPPPADLEQRQAAASAALNVEKSVFPILINSIQAVNDILKLAEAAGVKAIPLITEPWTTESVKDVDYAVFRLNIAVEGTYARLADLINRLERGEPDTLVIVNMSVNWGDALPLNADAAADAAADDLTLGAILNIVIYSRPPLAEVTVKADDQ